MKMDVLTLANEHGGYSTCHPFNQPSITQLQCDTVALCLKHWTLLLSSLSCINEWLAIDGGGYI